MARSKIFIDEIVAPNSSTSLIEFSAVPDAGAWTVVIGDDETASLDFDATAAEVQAAIRLLGLVGSPLSEAVVTGDYTTGMEVVLSDLVGPVEVGDNSLENSAVPVTTTVTFTNVYELDITPYRDLALGIYWGALPAGPEDLSLSASMDGVTFNEITEPDTVVSMDAAGGSHIYNCSNFNFKYLKINVPETDSTMEVRLQGIRFGV